MEEGRTEIEKEVGGRREYRVKGGRGRREDVLKW